MDPETLARITPGIDRLELKAEDKYLAHADVKIGPVRGHFKGGVNVTGKQPPNAFKLEIDQKSKIGNATAEVDITLSEKGDETEVSFTGKVRMSGMLARTGQRVIGSVVKMLSGQFFDALEDELKSI